MNAREFRLKSYAKGRQSSPDGGQAPFSPVVGKSIATPWAIAIDGSRSGRSRFPVRFQQSCQSQGKLTS
jgi:hypothetical protein